VRFKVSFEDECGNEHTQIISIKIKCCDGTQIDFRDSDEISVEETTISPNPVNDFFTINNSKSYTSYTIYSSSGQEISSDKLAEIESARVDASELSSGVYLLVLSNNEETETLKFVKQ